MRVSLALLSAFRVNSRWNLPERMLEKARPACPAIEGDTTVHRRLVVALSRRECRHAKKILGQLKEVKGEKREVLNATEAVFLTVRATVLNPADFHRDLGTAAYLIDQAVREMPRAIYLTNQAAIEELRREQTRALLASVGKIPPGLLFTMPHTYLCTVDLSVIIDFIRDRG